VEDSDLKELMKKIDTDGSGDIDWKEFVTAFASAVRSPVPH
jgi:hypothetical protein